MNLSSNWILFAFGAAIFGRLGVADIDSNLAIFIRTVVILVMIGLIVSWRHEWQIPAAIPANAWLFPTLSGAATGLTWLCFIVRCNSARCRRWRPSTSSASPSRFCSARFFSVKLYLGRPFSAEV